jgi:hypothetical protein
MKYAPQDEQTLMTELWDPQIADDLEKFVLFAYPWGKPNTPLCQHARASHPGNVMICRRSRNTSRIRRGSTILLG